MTIALGLVSAEGLVIAADSQETLGDAKTLSASKVVTALSSADPPCIIAGAGWSDYIETAREQVLGAISDCQDLAAAQRALDACLLRFFRQRIRPWSVFKEDQQPSVELLVGVSTQDASGLFHYSGTAFHRCLFSGAIGIGAHLANSLISQYCSDAHSVEQLVALASYIIHKVKQGVIGCGGCTQIGALRPGRDFARHFAGVEAFEAEIDRLERQAIKDFKAQLFASPSAPKLTWVMDEDATQDKDG